MGTGRLRFAVCALATAGLLAPASAAVASSGPIQSGLGSPTSRRTLRPGVTLTVYKLKVLDGGVRRTEHLYKVNWKIGNAHVQLHSGILGSVYSDDASIRLNRISSWWSGTGSPSSMTAAINGDFFGDSWRHSSAGIPSGVLIHARTIYGFGWGGPAVGYLPSGDMVMGRPSLRPTSISLPDKKRATIGAFNSLSTNGVTIHSDQVAAYVNPGTDVTVPTGYVGYVVPSTILRTTLRGSRGGLSFARGAGVKETVASFRFAVPGVARVTSSMPTSQPAVCPTGTCDAGVVLTVPSDGVVLLAKAGGVAATGLSARAAGGLTLRVATDPANWANVRDVMGGKPQLVNDGRAISQRPNYVDSWQWDNPHWRPAVVRTANGHGWLLLVGGKYGVGIKGLTWAKMLVQLGAQDAMGFDNNSSAELFRPGARPITAYGYERGIPAATYLSYN